MATGANTSQKLEKINGVIAQAIHRVYAQDVRSVLDEQLHFIPLDIETISLVLANKLDEEFPANNIEALYQDILEYFTTEVNKKLPITKKLFTNDGGTFTTGDGIELNSELELKQKVSEKSLSYKYLSALVYNQQKKLLGILAPSFDSASKQIITNLFNNKLKKYLKDYSSKYNKTTGISKGYDLGHIYSGMSLQNMGVGATTPATEKTKEVIREIERNLANISDIGQKEKLQQMLAGINSRFDALKKHSTYAPQVFTNIDKSFKDAALKIGVKINVVIPQDRYENQGIYAALYEGPLIRYIYEELKTMNFSRNLEEEIAFRIASTIEGKLVQDTVSSIKSKGKKTSLNVSGKRITIDGVKSPAKTRTTSRLVNKVAPTFSLISIINNQLQDQIRKNMGTGNRRDILNYRTGRFASSVKVERISESRQGMLTAFYSYMKYPYATFSKGGRQQFPASRDPKLLISKSIREIASSMVSNQLRAVAL